jgi:signal transduction histidine kinase
VVELYADRIDTQRVAVGRGYARDLPQVWVDAEALYRALVNLVANALDAMPGGGTLTLRAGWSHEAGSLRPARAAGGRSVQIEVSDTGPGIAAADVDRIFLPFVTTKDGGTGLGLALTHRIVEDHGGAIDVRSAPGAGATFRIVLPVVPEVAPERRGGVDGRG